MSALLHGSVTVHEDCVTALLSTDGDDRTLDLLYLDTAAWPTRPRGKVTLDGRLGSRKGSRELSGLKLVFMDGGWSVAVELADATDPNSTRWVVLTEGGRQPNGDTRDYDAWLLGLLGLFPGSLTDLKGEERLALARLWAENAAVLPAETVMALQGARLSAAERAVLAPVLYPRGDTRYAGAHVYIPGTARLLVNGREVVGRAVKTAMPGDERVGTFTEFILPVGGDLTLRPFATNLDDQRRVVVDSQSSLFLVGPWVLPEGREIPRSVQTSQDAEWTLCDGRAPTNAVCPRVSGNDPADFHASAKRGDEKRWISFHAAAAGDYALSWGEDRLELRWTAE